MEKLTYQEILEKEQEVKQALREIRGDSERILTDEEVEEIRQKTEK